MPHVNVVNINTKLTMARLTWHTDKKSTYPFRTIFSSPEHKVLMVSYCDRALSVVRRRPSSVVRRPSCVVRRA